MKIAEIEFIWAKFSVKYLEFKRRRRLLTKLGKALGRGRPVKASLLDIYDDIVATTGKKDTFAVAISNWVSKLEAGDKLGSAMEGWLPTSELMLIKAGDASGKQDETLIAAQILNEINISQIFGVIKALIGPVVYMVFIYALLMFFSIKLIPLFSSLMHCNWHGVAYVLATLANFLEVVGGYIGVVSFILIVVIFYKMPSYDGKFRQNFDNHFPWSLYRVSQVTSWLYSTSFLINAKVPLETTLIMISNNGSIWLKNRLQAIIKRLRAGDSVGIALQKSGYEFPTRAVISDLSSYSRNESFDVALNYVCKDWQEDSKEYLDNIINITKAVFFILTVVVLALMWYGMFDMQKQTELCMKYH